MKLLLLLSVIVLLVGCDEQDADSFLTLSDSIPLSEEDFGAQHLPQHVPDGTQYPVPVVGVEALDGSFCPIVALCNPVPRGGSVAPVRVRERRFKVFRGVDSIAENNELLGIYEIDSKVDELQIGFSITREGQLNLLVTDPLSGRNLRVRQATAVTSIHIPRTGS